MMRSVAAIATVVAAMVGIAACVPVAIVPEARPTLTSVCGGISGGDKVCTSLQPLLKKTIAYAGLVLPQQAMKKSGAGKLAELTETMLVQEYKAEAYGAERLADVKVEDVTPKPTLVVEAMSKVGALVGSIQGYNPIEVFINCVGKDDMEKIVGDLMHFPIEFPEFTQEQALAAAGVAIEDGIGAINDDAAMDKLINLLDTKQRKMLETLYDDVENKLLGSVMTVEGNPTPEFTREVSSQIARMTDSQRAHLPPSFLHFTHAGAAAGADSSPSGADERLGQALVAIESEAKYDGALTNLLPQISNLVVVSSVVVPAMAAKHSNVAMKELTGQMLVQEFGVVSSDPTLREMDEQLPEPEKMLNAMVAIGAVMGGKSKFNPVVLMRNVVGEKEMIEVIDHLMRFPLRFPDLSDEQVAKAQQVLLAAGLGFTDESTAINQMLDTLDITQRSMVETMEKDVMERLVGSMINPVTYEPTQKLVEEVKSELRELEKTNSTADMPIEFRSIVQQGAPSVSIEEIVNAQSLVALSNGAVSQDFKHFLPLVNDLVVYTGAVIPFVHAKKTSSKISELTETSLVQTVAQAATEMDPKMAAEIEKDMAPPDVMLNAMVAIGAVMGGSSGFNPMQLMTNVVGKDVMTECVDDMMHFPLRFPDPTDDEIMAAEQAMLAVGLGFVDEDTAMAKFMDSLQPEKKQLIEKVQKDVFDKIIGAMVDEKGEPTPALVAEIQREMADMENRTGSSNGMPEEFRAMVAAKEPVSAELLAGAQALIALKPDVTGQFKNFIPLVNQVVMYSTVALPMANKAKAAGQEKIDPRIGESALLGLADAANDDMLPSAKAVREAMTAIGELLSNGNGYNPVVMMTNVMGGDAEMDKWMDSLMHLPKRLPEPTKKEIEGAENVLLMYGLGFESEEEAIAQFENVLTPETRSVVQDVQKNLVEKLINAMVDEKGNPSAALVEEIKRQMREMQNKTGGDSQMPDVFKDIVVASEQKA